MHAHVHQSALDLGVSGGWPGPVGSTARLYNAGALTSYVVPSDEGPHRKYYGLNTAGRALLEQSTKTWGSFSETLDSLLREEAAA